MRSKGGKSDDRAGFVLPIKGGKKCSRYEHRHQKVLLIKSALREAPRAAVAALKRGRPPWLPSRDE